jgi:hypothetical protein
LGCLSRRPKHQWSRESRWIVSMDSWFCP